MSAPSTLVLDKGRPVHLVGAGGSGMSGLAGLLLSLGYRVSGSDLAAGAQIESLRAAGMVFHQGHAAENVGDAGLLAYSSAIREDNPERARAREMGIPEVRRATLLCALLQSRRALVVSGTHGKTTTTGMLAAILRAAGVDPGFYIGGEVPGLGGNASWGGGDFFVVEADESDGSFVEFEPHCAIVLNVEPEHLDHFADINEILAAFGTLCDRTRDRVFYCRDDENAAKVCAWRGNAISYGLREGAQVRAEQVELRERGSAFFLRVAGAAAGRIELRVPGAQNVLNATGAMAVALHLGVSFESAAAGLREFTGARRRFDVRFEDADFMVVDDYGHHPTEIRATLAAARHAGRSRVFAVFQPHRYTRTRHLLADFGAAFADADRVLLTDIYSAGEAPMPGVDGQAVYAEVARRKGEAVAYERDLRGVTRRIWREMQPGDLVLVLGAGSISGVAAETAAKLRLFTTLRKRLSAASRLARNEPLAKHTTMRVGGPADIWVEAGCEEDLVAAVRTCSELGAPVTVIGRGSNLVVRDGGIRGVCLRAGGPGLSSIEILGDCRLRAGAGARLKAIATEARNAGISGLEFLEGIPGSLGGALRMNAGAMGGWTFECVESVRMVDFAGNVLEQGGPEFDVRYRDVPQLRENIAVSAVLRGKAGEPAAIAKTMASYGEKRWKSQPAMASAGCMFKNPPDCPAGKLIDELGLKGTSVGAAQVSDVHGNFLVNRGGARAADVLELIERVRRRVREARGIELETEAIFLGEDE